MGRRHFKEPVAEVEAIGGVEYPPPMTFTINPAGYIAPTQYSSADMETARKRCKVMGFDENAIVCLREEPKYAFKQESVYNWGYIAHLNYSYVPGEEYKPIKVKWFNPPTHQGKVDESFYPEDLFLIHASVDKTLLGQIFASQDEEEE